MIRAFKARDYILLNFFFQSVCLVTNLFRRRRSIFGWFHFVFFFGILFGSSLVLVLVFSVPFNYLWIWFWFGLSLFLFSFCFGSSSVVVFDFFGSKDISTVQLFMNLSLVFLVFGLDIHKNPIKSQVLFCFGLVPVFFLILNNSRKITF